MTIRNSLRFALLRSTSVQAYDNTPGWKKDADGKLALDGDGNPIYVNAAGAEQSVKGDTISTLNAEARAHRTAKEAAEAELKKYEVNGKRVDPIEAVKAVDTISKIDAKKLIDAGEVDRVREQIKGEFTEQLTEKDKRIGELANSNKTLMVDRAFDGSEFVRDRVAVPRDMFRDSFGKNVKVTDDGKLEFYGRDGNRLLSKKNAGEYASGDEAFELLVEQHPQKDTILKAAQSGGTGNNGGGGQQGKGRVVKRADFDAMDPGAQVALSAAMQKGEVQVVD